MQTYAEQLRAVRDSLTKENWNQGSWFTRKNNTICMCVHGAAQAIVNPQVRTALDNDYYQSANYAKGHVTETIAIMSHYINTTSKDLFSLWKNRPDFVKREIIYNEISYGFVNLHYLMRMFGISLDFNDSKNTTLDMIKDKLSEAAKWAEENEEFLQNN